MPLSEIALALPVGWSQALANSFVMMACSAGSGKIALGTSFHGFMSVAEGGYERTRNDKFGAFRLSGLAQKMKGQWTGAATKRSQLTQPARCPGVDIPLRLDVIRGIQATLFFVLVAVLLVEIATSFTFRRIQHITAMVMVLVVGYGGLSRDSCLDAGPQITGHIPFEKSRFHAM